MMRVGLFFVVFFASCSALAGGYLYGAIGQPDLYFDFKSNSVTEGDAEVELKKCSYNKVVFCISLRNHYLAIPEDVSKPLKVNFSDSEKLIFLPIRKKVHILGQTFIGYESSILDSSGKINSVVFFNKENGVIFFRLGEHFYWSYSRSGIEF